MSPRLPRRTCLAVALLTAGCATPSQKPAPPAPVAATPSMNPAGLESVIGRTARFLETQFGKPDLDIREGSARKLQFSSQVCVLDAYLYQEKGGGEPIVTYIDARLPDGRDIDRASCVAALQQRQKSS